MNFNTAKNLEEYIYNFKVRTVILAFFSIVTLVATILSLTIYTENSFRGGFFTGMCGAFTAFTIIHIITLKNKAKLNRDFIQITDERNVEINKRSAFIAFNVLNIFFAFSAIVFAFIDKRQTMAFAFLIFLSVIIQTVAKFVLSKRM